MNPAQADRIRASHVLLFEPRIEGHHLAWLRMMIEDLLSGGLELSVAVRQDEAARASIAAQMGDLMPQVTVVPLGNGGREPRPQTQLRLAATLLDKSGADTVFFCCLDEVASSCLRRAAIGLMPPQALWGKFGGIFLRPRFLVPRARSVNNALKAAGFRRLSGQGWFRQVFFTDERLCGRALERLPGAPFFPLADPPTQAFDQPAKAARAALSLPDEKRVFLFYGGAYRRKGLHLAVRAMHELRPDHPSLLLCVGRQSPEPEIAAGLAQLAQQGRALAINRYVTPEEEKIAFSACDVVLLPYIAHFGSSGVMAQAAAAGKPMIASDENLVGARVRDYRLGWLFKTGDATRLRQAIDEAARAAPERLAEFASGAVAYSRAFSRAAFRRSLLASFGCEAA